MILTYYDFLLIPVRIFTLAVLIELFYPRRPERKCTNKSMAEWEGHENVHDVKLIAAFTLLLWWGREKRRCTDSDQDPLKDSCGEFHLMCSLQLVSVKRQAGTRETSRQTRLSWCSRYESHRDLVNVTGTFTRWGRWGEEEVVMMIMDGRCDSVRAELNRRTQRFNGEDKVKEA